MFTLIAVSFSLFFLTLTGWTITTYLIKEDSQASIKEELENLLSISKTFFLSVQSLIGVLLKYSFFLNSSETSSPESNELDEQSRSTVRPIKAVEVISSEIQLEEDDDTALSSFSPEVVEVINEEEEKVA